MPHGRHIYAKAYDMAKAEICKYLQSDNGLPHLKFVLRCCAHCPSVNLPDQGTDKKHEETTPSIRFLIYHIIARCTARGIIPLKDMKICYMCKQESSSNELRKIYTRKGLVMMETTISNFCTSFYIPAIQNLAFFLPHVRILGTNCCGAMQRTAFKRSELSQDVLCRRDYDQRVVVSFANQIQSEYYGLNRSMSIEGIALEYFSALP